MTLGTYEFPLLPARIVGLDSDSLVREKASANVNTLTGNVLFVWSPVTAGSEIVLEWERIDADFWNQLQAMAESTDTYTFDPDIGGTTYTVAVIGLEAQGRDPNGMSRVRLTLNVRS